MINNDVLGCLPRLSNLNLLITKMSDPLSVAASIAGLISITVEAVKFLSPYVSATKETPQVAAHVYSEVQSTQVILMGLQSLTKNLGSVKIQHAALIGVNQVVAILTDGVLLYSELHKELGSLRAKDGVGKVPLRGRLQWVWKESTFITLLNRLQSFRSSMTLVLIILQSDSGQTAKEHQEQLSNNVKVLLDSNDALSRRLMNIEDALDTQAVISRRMSLLSLAGSPSQDTTQNSQSDATESPATSINTDTSNSISKFDFEDDLESSRVYRRALRETMDFSFRSSVARSHNWSVFSGLSLGDISIMSFIALPVYQDDITNAEHYDFGEEVALTSEIPGPMMDQPLLMDCLEIKLKLLTIPEMQKYFDEEPYPPDAFFHVWSVFQQITPLVILAQALDLDVNLDIGPPEDLTISFKKEIILWFAQYCHDILNIETRNLITVEDLMGGGYYGILRVISLVSNITKCLVITGPSINDFSSAKAQVDAQSPELRGLLAEQRQFIQDLNELLEIKDQLEMYMKSIFQNTRQLMDLHIAFLINMERNLLRPSAEHNWAPAFDYLLRNIEIEAATHATDKGARTSIQIWLKEGHFRDKDKTRALLARCFDILPTRAKRISALFAFSEYLKRRPSVTNKQRKDSNSARSSISKIVAQLQDNVISKETQAAVQKLQQRIQDWKGIDPDALGELILSKTLYVTKSSKTNLYHGYLFQNMLLLCKDARGEPTRDRSFYRSKSLSEQKQTMFLLKGRFHLRHILSVTPTSQHDKHVCEVQWGTDNSDGKSKFSLVFAVESEMRHWALKIDEYRMMAILMVKPKEDPEGPDSSIEGNTDEPASEDSTVSIRSWKRYGVI
ncbi:Pleckstrin homology domain-containing protein [Fusarium redolens]|uniref:Pleckstrin homology domain-containing protein n=1 Tax=Fusarium redolens TaxID=48865 RepID=A0A9P9HD89_FUSRE|nr:Pleckstrin homology domain-containing protein [Fusarium redolens]KAH7254364.1 Pleckstrin homology domain-containing protein [Fusarium redolens]